MPRRFRARLRAVIGIALITAWSLASVSGLALWAAPHGPRSGRRELLLGLAKREWVTCTGSTQVHVSADVSGFTQHRQRRLRDRLTDDRVELVTHDEVVTVVAPQALTTSDGEAFAVFSPYHRRWKPQPIRRLVQPPRKGCKGTTAGAVARQSTSALGRSTTSQAIDARPG